MILIERTAMAKAINLENRKVFSIDMDTVNSLGILKGSTGVVTHIAAYYGILQIEI
jgi:hypothetical protein